VAVRIGFDDNHALGEKETGGRAALPIFREIMLHAYQRELVGPVPPFPREIEERIDQYLVRQAGLKAERDNPQPPGLDDRLPRRVPIDTGTASAWPGSIRRP